jgi:hypothetical protein
VSRPDIPKRSAVPARHIMLYHATAFASSEAKPAAGTPSIAAFDFCPAVLKALSFNLSENP